MATSIAALTPLSFFLTACGGGSSIDGTYYYYGKDHAGEGSQLSIKGANTTFLDLDTNPSTYTSVRRGRSGEGRCGWTGAFWR